MNSDAINKSNPPAVSGRPVRVWDLPTRVFHWLLLAFVIVSFVTGKIGGLWMQYHKWSGYTILGLIVFRLIWGFVGGRYARFSAFVRGPGAVLCYARDMLRRDTPKYLGHNPMGGWSVLAMLTALLVQAITGLFANDDIFTTGPLYPWVSKATSDWLTHIHRLNQNLIILLVSVHLLAILFYLLVKHDNLIKPMVTGRKQWHGEGRASADHWKMAALLSGVIAIGVYLLGTL